jgi:hypothetical protein
MKALNGWQRIGIVLSVLWATVGFVWVDHSVAFNIGARFVEEDYDRCLWQRSIQPDGSVPKDTDWQPCINAFDRDWDRAVKYQWITALYFALIPILTAWLVAYGLVVVGRWIAAGFRRQ